MLERRVLDVPSTFNTVLEARNGACSGARIACNDDSSPQVTSKLTLTLSQGQTIVLIIGGRSGSHGVYTLHVQ